MKRKTMSFGQSLEYTPPHPERTARKSGRGLNFDVTFQEWPNRASMAKTIRMQQQRASQTDDWRAVVPLKDWEGY
jgi:hypothetical protein